ncbi:hypothetical protein AB4Z19_24430 [Pseudoduganella sp. RAF19]|uniref:hypothetical protein n=1 Tax=Pseudoduganella sp. RAF19 TaxID=3233052 RepID=UPI003F97663F
MTKRRSRNLDDEIIKQIVEIIDGWSGDLTWAKLIHAIELRHFSCYTRQALHNHERIREAFRLRKEEAASSRVAPTTRNTSLQIASERIARLETENRRLIEENRRLLEKFATWAYNAYSHGVNEEALSRPLLKVDRGQTR